MAFTESDIFKLQQKGLKVNDPVMDNKLRKACGLPSTASNVDMEDAKALMLLCKKKATKTTASAGKDKIEWVLKGLQIPFEREYVFHSKRKFRFDWCILKDKVAIEFEGGIFDRNGGHTSVSSFLKDSTKYNLAVLDGWRVLRYTALNYKQFGADITKLLGI